MAQNKGFSGVGFIVLMGSLTFAFILTFVTKDYVRVTSVKEAQKIEQQMGTDTLERINGIAGSWYARTFSRLEKELSAENMMSKDPEQRAREKELLRKSSRIVSWAEGRKAAMLDLGYWVLRRLALFGIWLPLWFPILLLAVYHGWNDRAIKKTDFGYTSPVLNHWARQVIALVVMLTLLLFVVPIAIDPFIFPVCLSAIAAATGVAFGNIQKRI